MLLVLDFKKEVFRIGIIDYMRFYTWDKKFEEIFKKITKRGKIPTIIEPAEY